MTMSMEDRLNLNIETWRPDLDDNDHPKSAWGEIIEITFTSGEYGESPVVVFTKGKSTNEAWRLYCYGQILGEKFEQKAPQEGWQCGFGFLGNKPQRRNPSKTYSDWNAFFTPPEGRLAGGDEKATKGGPAAALGALRPDVTAEQDATNRRAAAEVGDEYPSEAPSWLDSEEAF